MKSQISFRLRSSLLAIFFLASFSSPMALAQNKLSSVEEWIRLAEEKSETVQALDQSLEALEFEIRARDLELSAFLSADLSDTRDERTSFSNQRPLRHRQLLETSLEKPFATGTSVSLLLSHQIAETNPAGDTSHLGNWEFTIAQDLWRNAFGRGTRLRRNSDKAEFQSRRFETYSQRQALLIEIERIYWELALALKEEQIRSTTIQRSETLERWIRDRVRKFAAESSDLFQVQALISQRRLELLENRNRIATLQTQIRQLLPVPGSQELQPDLALLETPRNPKNLLATQNSSASSTQPLSLVSLSSQYRFDQARLEAERVEDVLRPSLQAYASHGRNGIDSTASTAWDRARSNEFPATTVGVRLSMDLDSGLKGDRKKAAQLTAEASALQARAESRKGELAWSDLLRQIENLKSQTEEAKKLLRFQSQKSNEEQRRYRQGRSTAFQAITFESDAALSELRLYQLYATLRKAESQARSFIVAEEVKL